MVLFVLVVVGILAKRFWKTGFVYLNGMTDHLAWGDLPDFLVRAALGLIAAELLFFTTYNKIGQPTAES